MSKQKKLRLSDQTRQVYGTTKIHHLTFPIVLVVTSSLFEIHHYTIERLEHHIDTPCFNTEHDIIYTNLIILARRCASALSLSLYVDKYSAVRCFENCLTMTGRAFDRQNSTNNTAHHAWEPSVFTLPRCI